MEKIMLLRMLLEMLTVGPGILTDIDDAIAEIKASDGGIEILKAISEGVSKIAGSVNTALGGKPTTTGA